MARAFIKMAYRQVIDVHAESQFERNVLDASYAEFLLKSQAYNKDGRYKTFTAMKANDGRANSLHYKTGFAIGHYINSLNSQVPGLQDTLGKNISFIVQQFELIESAIDNKTAHKVAITYYTDTLVLCGNIGDYMILAYPGNTNKDNREPLATFLLKIRPNLTISGYCEMEVLNLDLKD